MGGDPGAEATEFAAALRARIAGALEALGKRVEGLQGPRAAEIAADLARDVAGPLPQGARALSHAIAPGLEPAGGAEELDAYRAGDPRVRLAWALAVLEKRAAEAEGVLLAARLDLLRARADAGGARLADAARARVERAVGALLAVVEAWARTAAGKTPPSPGPAPARARAALTLGFPEAALALLDGEPADLVETWRRLDLAERPL